MIIPQNRCSTLSIITRARSLDYVPATNTGVWNVPSSRLEKMMVTKNTFMRSKCSIFHNIFKTIEIRN